MKQHLNNLKVTGIVFLLSFSSVLFSQAPQGFSYQAVARDGARNPLSNTSLTVYFSILDGSDQLIWKEEHDVTTNDLGMFSTIICNDDADKTGGSASALADISWGASPHSLQVEVHDGSSLVDLGKSPLMSVPYAQYAHNGPIGPVGPEGLQGVQGEIGPEGAQGPDGSSGIQGIQGIQGDPGVLGPQGDPGLQGEKGDKGDPGTGLSNLGDWISGTSYNPGDYVFDRSTDNELIKSMWILEDQIAYLSSIEPYTDPTHWVEFQAPEGPEGPLGPTGPQGLQGIQGLQGSQGIQGIPGDPASDDQSLILSGTELSITGGNLVDLAVLQDADADPNNEIQDLQLIGDQLSITNNIAATPIDLGAFTESNVGWNRDGDNVVYVNGNVGVGTITPEGRLSVQGVSEAADEPLFMVTRKDGYPVFAVYEDGVYAFTDTVESAKGIKGGFAVGGYNKLNKGLGVEYMRVTADSIRFYIEQDISGTKGVKGGFAVGGYNKLNKGAITGDEFLRVTPDSVRIYIDDSPDVKGIKGGFAVGGYNKLNKGEAEYFNISTQDAAEVIPGENRLVWYPHRNAFMTGNVLVEHPDSVGENSMASGYQVKAKGAYSQAFGYKSTTTGPFSTAIGESAIADTSSFAFGKNALATGNESFAFGSGAKASGLRSFSFGSVGLDSLGNPIEENPTNASGNYSIAMGLGAIAEKKGSMSFGVSSQSAEEYALSIGFGSMAMGRRSIAIGSRANYGESVNYPAPFIYQHYNSNMAKGDFATSIGSGNVSEAGGFALGLSNKANGWGSVAIGFGNTSNGEKSIASGYHSESNGKYSVAIGNYVTAEAFNSTVIGSFNLIAGNPDLWVATDPLFVIGNGENKGSSTVRSNAFMVTKQGDARVYGNLYGYNQIKASRALLSDSLILGSYKGFMINTRPVIKMKEYKNFPIPAYSKEYTIKVSSQIFTISDENVDILKIAPGSLIVNGNLYVRDAIYSEGTSNLMIGKDNGDAMDFRNGMDFWRTDGDWKIEWDGSHFGPYVNNDMDLGTSTKKWKTGYFSGALYTGTNIEVNSGLTANRNAYIDFIGDNVYTDYGLRLRREPNGQNSNSGLVHRGTGMLYFMATEAGTIGFYTSSARRITILPNGFTGIGTAVPITPLQVKTTAVTLGVVRGESTYAGTAVNYGAAFEAKYGTNGIGCFAAGSLRDFFAGGPGTNFFPFTGSHEVILSEELPEDILPGMIVSLTGYVEKRYKEDGSVSLSSTMPEITISVKDKDKAVFGVFISEDQHTEDHWLKKEVRVGTVNALGEGRVWVCNSNGGIEAGDYLTTSFVPGYGQKQKDDLLHNYTLGKATETIDWNTVSDEVTLDGKKFKVYLIGVIYTSG